MHYTYVLSSDKCRSNKLERHKYGRFYTDCTADLRARLKLEPH